jgi:hypothetical protein
MAMKEKMSWNPWDTNAWQAFSRQARVFSCCQGMFWAFLAFALPSHSEHTDFLGEHRFTYF